MLYELFRSGAVEANRREEKQPMNQHAKWLAALVVLIGSLALLSSATAETIITTFADFNLDGVYASWVSATIVSLPISYSVTAAGFGSGYKALTPNIDATTETNIELTVTLTGSASPNAPISGPIVSLVDADGTFYNYAWYGQTQGTHVLRMDLNTPTFISAVGNTSGLDLSRLAFFHLQDDPGVYSGQYTIAFELLRLTGAPPPSITTQSYDPSTQQFSLTWTSLTGKAYTVLYSADLVAPFSPLVTDIPSNGNSTTTTLVMPSGDAGYLRVQQQ
jgi:hypothetical protein